MSKEHRVAGQEPTALENLGCILRNPLYNLGKLFGGEREIRQTIAKIYAAEALDPAIGRPGHPMSVREVLEDNGYNFETGKPDAESDVWRDLLAAKAGAR